MHPIIQTFTQAETQLFVQAQAHSPTQNLALKYRNKYSFDLKIVASMLAIWKKMEAKLPFFREKQCLFTQKMYEQSTDQLVAQFKQSLVVKGESLLDLTAGAGVDAYFLAQNFEQAHLLEQDPTHFELLTHNFGLLGVTNATFYENTAEAFLSQNLTPFSAIYIDPDRRVLVQKAVQLAHCSPNICALLPQLLRLSPHIYLKTSPLIDLTAACLELDQKVAQIWVIALQNEVKEILFELCSQTNAQPKVTAVNLSKSGEAHTFCTPKTAIAPPFATSAKYLYEPNASIIKAGLVPALATHFGLEMLHKNTAYLVSQCEQKDFFGRSFSVLHQLKYQPKHLVKQLKELDISQANIAARNFYDKPDELFKTLKLKPGGDVYLFFTTDYQKNAWCFVCRKSELTPPPHAA